MLRVHGLSKVFTLHALGGKKIIGFRDVSFNVKEGSALAISGRSGAGKSSILKCIYRTYLPTSGRIEYRSAGRESVDLVTLSEYDILRLRQREIGYVTQFLRVLPRVSALDTVAEPLILSGVNPDDAYSRTVALLRRLRIPEKLFDASPISFSGGEQQRVNIARAIILRPRLLLLDEPTASLDRASIEIIVELLRELREQGTTLVMIFHDQEIIDALAEDIYRIPEERNASPLRKAGEDDFATTPGGKRTKVFSENSRENDCLSLAASFELSDHGHEEETILRHVDAVLPDKILRDVSVSIRGGKIEAIAPLICASPSAREIYAPGMLLMPGFIDLHSDAIEKEIRPRPGGSFPLEIAIAELDKRLAACGITTMYHCLCFGGSENNDLRTAEKTEEISAAIRDMERRLTVRNRIHIRFEITDLHLLPRLQQFLIDHGADFFSIMDHTPGQGQFADTGHFMTYYSQCEYMSRDQAFGLAVRRKAIRKAIDDARLFELMKICRDRRIPMASHDDDTPEKISWIYNLGIRISEFPVCLTAAEAACRLGMRVLMGAPNVLRGASLTGNLSAQDALRKGVCSMLGSDYAPMSMLHAVFAIHRQGIMPLHECVKLITFNPARAVGIDHERGALREGLCADLVLVDASSRVPRIAKTFVAGQEIFSAPVYGREGKPAIMSSKESRHGCHAM